MAYSKGSDFAPHTMSGASTPSPYVAGDNGHFGVLPAYLAFDGAVGASHYFIGTATGNVILVLDIGSGNAKRPFSYAIQVNSVPEAARAPKDWTFQGSNDNFSSDINTLDTVTSETSWGSAESREFNCDALGGTYRYFRLLITANNGDASFTQVAELFIYEADGTPDPTATQRRSRSSLGTRAGSRQAA